MLLVFLVGCWNGIIIEEVLDIFFNLYIDLLKVVWVVLMLVFKNVVFVVDIEVCYVKIVKSLLFDDFGVWKGIGVKMFYFWEFMKLNFFIKVFEVMFGVVGVYWCIWFFYWN